MTKKTRPKKTKSNKITRRKRIIMGLLSLLLVLMSGAGIIAFKYYDHILKVNVDLGNEQSSYIYIPTGSDFDDVKDIFYKDNFIINKSTFEWLAEKKAYTNAVKPGRYLIKNGMTNNELINLLRSGKQDPVKITFNNIRTKEQFVSRVCPLIEADSLILLSLLNDEVYLEKFDMNTENVMCIFIPNTYELYWNTPADKFFERMYEEYSRFWNESRVKKAQNMNLSREEVTILASIVYQETRKKDEMSRVAGVYINRLKKGMPLQADPTVIFALRDFNIKRVLKWQLEVNSPYNTYKFAGLPPGPICLPDPVVIDKVLDYEKHSYLYFCAKDDLSGYHNFAETGAQHAANARRYHDALNKLKIKK